MTAKKLTACDDVADDKDAAAFCRTRIPSAGSDPTF
jgi:hypothetical protein